MKSNLFLVVVAVFLLSFVGASSNVVQSYNPSINSLYSSSDIATYWPSLSNSIGSGTCKAGTDFLVVIPVDGCSPSVVRSDLLAEQNVPVFCKLKAVNVNPLVDVNKIDSISFKGDYPDDVISVSYHPARAAVDMSSDVLLGSPVVNDIGYVVIVLKKTANESAMKEWIYGNLTATMHYDAEDAYGVGQSEFFLESVTNENWESDYVENSFWNGKGYLRLKDLRGETARIEVYTGKDDVYTDVLLKEGETSGEFYFPGSYCQSGLKIKLNSIVANKDSALLDIDGNSIWVRQGTKFLDGACTVSRLSVGAGSVGTITFSCRGSKVVTLSLTSKNVANVGGELYNVGDLVSDEGEKNTYLGYVGVTESALWEGGVRKVEAGVDFVVLVNLSSQTLALEDAKVTKISNAIANFFDTKRDFLEKKSLESAIQGASGEGAIVLYNAAGLNGVGSLVLNGVEARESDGSITDARDEVQKYFDEMEKSQSRLTDLYPQEGAPQFGSLALKSEIEALRSMSSIGMSNFGMVAKLIEKFSELYPASNAMVAIKQGSMYDYSNAFATVYTNNNYRKITLLAMKGVDKSTKTAEFSYDGGYQEVYEGKNVYVGEEGKSDYFAIRSIERNSVEVAYYKFERGKYVYRGAYPLKEGEERDINNNVEGDIAEYTLRVSDISVVEVASVSLISELSTSSEANFTYRIGVEKRSIEISPKKATEMADKLNDTIAKWEERNAKFGELIKTWKGACLLTSAALQIKTLFGGFSGAGSARQEVMDVYKEECKTNATYKDMTSSECYAAQNKRNEIDNDVTAYKNAITKINSPSGDGVGGKSIEQWQMSCGATSIYAHDGVTLNCSDLNSWSDIKLYLLNKYINASSSGASSGLKTQTKNDFEVRMKTLSIEKKSRDNADIENAKLSGKYEDGKSPVYTTIDAPNTNAYSGEWSDKRAGDVKSRGGQNLTAILNQQGLSIKDDTPIQFVPYNGKNYLLILTSGVSEKRVSQIYLVGESNGEDTYEKRVCSSLERGSQDKTDCEILQRTAFVSGTTGTCKTGYHKNTKYTVEYYETGTNKGNPAKVPFDSKNGWYVRISSSTGGMISDNVKSYQDSGAVSYFKICNVGENQREDDNDECTGINVNNNVDSFENIAGCSLSKPDVEKLIRDAQLAIKQAQQNYGKKSFSINVGGRGAITVVGAEAVSDLNYECEDFMSPDDCHTMYNVCDPVICPSSRCDFGGKMKVANVIQSGIVGSVLLCLPNFGSPSNGGVLVPVCLTGIHAGIEGYVSILRSEQKCLLEAAKTGAHTGICDEVTAVYKCEFFWRQVSPLMDNLVSSLAEFVATGGISKKGGGEYLTFQDSWNNMEKSIDYFKNTYATTSFGALEFGNVEEIGSEICQNFIGTSVPTTGDVFDSLLEPESPYQFYAQFSEIELTDATVPATSQYKVYYHIYAGNDQGVSYQVYLKDPVEMSYVSVPQRVYVDTGYVAIGEEADEAKDITAPAGYKQLCVVINNIEECGFKSVTTDVGLDMLHDSYVNDQVEDKNIKTEKECSQGTSSIYSLLNLNVEEGVDETINPDITLSGIVRVCSNDNPGFGANDTNWEDVGYCGDTSVRCWLDQASLREGVYEILKATKSVANTNDVLDAGAKSLASNDSEEVLSNVKKNISALELEMTDNKINDNNGREIAKITNLIEGSNLYSNRQKANLIYLEFTLYEKITNFLVGKISEGNAGKKNTIVPTEPEVAIEEAESEYSLDGDGCIMDSSGSRIMDGSYYYCIEYSGNGYQIMKQTTGGNNRNSVGSIDADGSIEINEVDVDLVGLEDYGYDSESGVFVLE